MEGVVQDRRMLRRIAATFVALALLAERAAGRSFPVRFLVLAILWRAEAIARAFVAREIDTDVPYPDWPFCDERLPMRGGAADAELLALRLRMLAAVLDVLSGAAGRSDDRSVDGPAGRAPRFGNALGHTDPILLFVFPAWPQRRAHDTS